MLKVKIEFYWQKFARDFISDRMIKVVIFFRKVKRKVQYLFLKIWSEAKVGSENIFNFAGMLHKPRRGMLLQCKKQLFKFQDKKMLFNKLKNDSV